MDQLGSAGDPEPDLAAEAFARLEMRISEMDGRIALMTRALEHIAIEKQGIEITDYTPTLTKMNSYLVELAAQAQKMAKAPALQMTPENMVDRIDQVARQAREADRVNIEQARMLLNDARESQIRAIGHLRTRREQRWHMAYSAMGAIVAVMLLWLFYPGWAASIGPQSWLWPERVARRTLGEATLWDSGTRLLQAGNPAAWSALVKSADTLSANRKALEKCEEAAAKADGPIRCRIEIRR
ncbi:hypothetical protein SAMN05518668_1256 [Sphingobium sp. YR657]|uniref:DUF6118 family protein n=1 Tax=Sphingobium sp. YR657 TaxID=1884366 RepID=UPI00091360E2|nr:DUF6118 family protein [Sphingobium sp. YR657]SHM72785.1 hypothetical protein SAMN05518668_1256 [Sphingobium sp. YR657]